MRSLPRKQVRFNTRCECKSHCFRLIYPSFLIYNTSKSNNSYYLYRPFKEKERSNPLFFIFMPQKLRAWWSKRERDIMIWSPCRPDGHWLSGPFNKTFIEELEKRGYNVETIRFSVERKPERDMWILSKNDKYWTGKSWHKSLEKAIVYDSEDEAEKIGALKKACVLNLFFEQRKEHQDQ